MSFVRVNTKKAGRQGPTLTNEHARNQELSSEMRQYRRDEVYAFPCMKASRVFYPNFSSLLTIENLIKSRTGRGYGENTSCRFVFQRSWFDEEIRPDWERLTSPIRGTKLDILEVGSFEGASTTWILDHLMTHPESRMTAIDTFEGGMEHVDPDQTQKYDISLLESRFRSNTSKCQHVNKLRVIKARSDDALLDLRRDGARFNFIYIDASHVAIDVLHDAVLCWRMLDVHGIMVFDDVAWKGYMEDCYNPRIAIKSFVQCVKQESSAMETEGQMWLTKVPNCVPATPNPDPALYYWERKELVSL